MFAALADYVFTYQLAVFTVLTALVAWGAAGLGVFDDAWPTRNCTNRYLTIQVVLWSLSSAAVRECWHAVLGAQMMLLIRYGVRRVKRRESNEQ